MAMSYVPFLICLIAIPNLFRDPICKVANFATGFACGVLKYVQHNFGASLYFFFLYLIVISSLVRVK